MRDVKFEEYNTDCLRLLRGRLMEQSGCICWIYGVKCWQGGEALAIANITVLILVLALSDQYIHMCHAVSIITTVGS